MAVSWKELSRESGGSRSSTFSVFVQTGRRRELARTAVLLAALHILQIPLFLTATERLTSVATLDAAVPARLMIAVDLACILTRLYVAYRAWGMLRSHRPTRRFVDRAVRCVGVVILGAGANLVADAMVWHVVQDRRLNLQSPIELLGVVGFLVSMAGLARLLYLAFMDGVTDDAYGGDGLPMAEPVSDHDSERPGAVICCSGGGIRASAFSLGGLQVLQRHGEYEKASAVIGVSGGGYIAAGYHVVRWNLADSPKGLTGDWEPAAPDVPVFSLASPELHWLRRHTRYVLDSLGTLIHAILSVTFGIAVNVLLLAVGTGAIAWLVGWLCLAAGRLRPNATSELLARGQPGWADGWEWVPWLCLSPFVIAVAVFLAEKCIERLMAVPVPLRKGLRAATQYLFLAGAALSALLLGLPWLIEVAAAWTATPPLSPDPAIMATVKDLVRKILFPPVEVVAGGGPVDPAAVSASNTRFVAANSLSFVTIVGAVVALATALNGQPSVKKAGQKWISRFVAKVWGVIKDPVIPYAAVSVIAVVGVVFLVRTTSFVVMEEGKVADWSVGLWLTVGLILVRVLTEPNRTSLHQFFRERISASFFVRRTSATGAEPVDYKVPLRFSHAVPKRGPRLVSCAVANVTDADLVPSNRGCTPFVFDDRHIGLTDRTLPAAAAMPGSALFEFAADERHRDVTLPAAVAMSAAAFSPLAGRENVRIAPYRVVLALGNARLGVWLPNPLWLDPITLVKRQLVAGDPDAGTTWTTSLTPHDRQYMKITYPRIAQCIAADGRLTPDKYVRTRSETVMTRVAPLRAIFKKAGIFSLIREAFGSASVYDRFLYVTDGGHYDNLGLIEALRRRPEAIYVLDASNDPEDTFRALGQAMATAQMDLGCTVTMDPRAMRRLTGTRSGAAWCFGTYRYPASDDDEDGTAGASGHIYLAKAILTENDPWDIETYADTHKDFPRTSTGRQLYSEFDFEAYRALGEYAVVRMLDEKKRRGAAAVTMPEPEEAIIGSGR